MTDKVAVADLELRSKVSKDLLKTAAILDRRQIRELVYMFYATQDRRKAASNQTRALAEEDRPNSLVRWIATQTEGLEKQIGKALEIYADSQPVGVWLQSIRGIGPKFAAGLLAYIDIEKCPTVGHIWSYAGLDPDRKWISAKEAPGIYSSIVPRGTANTEQMIEIAKIMHIAPEKVIAAFQDKYLTRAQQQGFICRRPFDAGMKAMCWNIGESFVKHKSKKDDIYGKLYDIRKAYEMEKNEKGDYAEFAAKRAKEVNKSTEAYGYYLKGVLSPGHIHSRAKRYAVKIFLSHVHYVMYREHYGVEPPKPFAIAILNHAHEIPVPNLDIMGW